jgi:hypothetical protein
MSYPQTSFTDLLGDLAAMAGLRIADLGDEQELLVRYLNAATKWAWRDYMEVFAHPATVTSDELTVTDGVLTRDQLEESDWASLWSADPRLSREARRYRPTVDGDGWHLGTSITTVYAFWRLALPKFTGVEVVPATDYEAGDRVWDADDSGHVYRCKVTGALGSELSDATKWERVTLPEVFLNAVLHYARYLWLQAKALPKNAESHLSLAVDALESEMGRVIDDTGLAPVWLQLNYR